MPFKTIPGIIGKIYVREEQPGCPKKHECHDCGFCQWCNDDKCRMCQSQISGESPLSTQKPS